MHLKEVAIIVAGGKGLRLPGDLPKQFIEIDGIPVLMHTLNAFRDYSASLQIVLVLPRVDVGRWSELCEKHQFDRNIAVVHGGESRFHSVKNGLNVITAPGLVAVHDGVRPLVTPEIIGASFTIARNYRSAVASVPLKESIRELEGLPTVGASSITGVLSGDVLPKSDSIKVGSPAGSLSRDTSIESISSEGGAGTSSAGVTPSGTFSSELSSQRSVSLDRTKFRLMQTPQTFDIELLKSAYDAARDDLFTDDASVVERAGHSVALFEGSYENLKITTPEDLIVAEAIVQARKKRLIKKEGRL